METNNKEVNSLISVFIFLAIYFPLKFFGGSLLSMWLLYGAITLSSVNAVMCFFNKSGVLSVRGFISIFLFVIISFFVEVGYVWSVEDFCFDYIDKMNVDEHYTEEFEKRWSRYLRCRQEARFLDHIVLKKDLSIPDFYGETS